MSGPTAADRRSTRLLKPGELDTILLPWAKKLMASRNDGQDPYNYCLPGGPLRITGGFAWRFVQHPTTNATHIFMLQEGNAHTYRQIFMDGRKHPEDPSPTWYGHSIGRWEGTRSSSTPSVSTTRFWLDGSGIPHTEQLHMVERWTRTNYTTLRRDVTFEDPGAFTKPFTVTYTARLAEPGSEILEYICIENNQYGLRGYPASDEGAKPGSKITSQMLWRSRCEGSSCVLADDRRAQHGAGTGAGPGSAPRRLEWADADES